MVIFRLRNISTLKVELAARYTRGYLRGQQIMNIQTRYHPNQMALKLFFSYEIIVQFMSIIILQ